MVGDHLQGTGYNKGEHLLLAFHLQYKLPMLLTAIIKLMCIH